MPILDHPPHTQTDKTGMKCLEPKYFGQKLKSQSSMPLHPLRRCYSTGILKWH